jgi:hypothetical protein
MSDGIFCGIGLMAYEAWGEAIRHCGPGSQEARAAKGEYEDHIHRCIPCQAGRNLLASEQGNIRDSKEWPEVERLLEEEIK